jgi:hypothetical protein
MGRYFETYDVRLILCGVRTYDVFTLHPSYKPQTRVPVPPNGTFMNYAGHIERAGATPSIPLIKVAFMPESELMMAFSQSGMSNYEERYVRLELRNFKV